MPCRWTHFPNARGQRICARPNCFDILPNRPSSSLHIAYVEIVPTHLAMPVDMPSRDCHVKLSRFWYLHFWWEILYTFSEVFGPLTTDVVCEDDSEEDNAD